MSTEQKQTCNATPCKNAFDKIQLDCGTCYIVNITIKTANNKTRND